MDKKRPKKRAKVQVHKQPRAPAAKGANKEVVQWTFAEFDAHEWFEKEYPHEPFSAIAQQMRQYESRTWAEIIANRWRDHTVACSRLIPEAQRRLRVLSKDDLGELWRFRFGAKLRLWGIRRGSMFSVLWWDPQHKICPSRKKGA